MTGLLSGWFGVPLTVVLLLMCLTSAIMVDSTKSSPSARRLMVLTTGVVLVFWLSLVVSRFLSVL